MKFKLICNVLVFLYICKNKNVMENKKAMMSFPALKLKVSDKNKSHTFVKDPNELEIKKMIDILSFGMDKKNIIVSIGY
jgi:hypothetical protein